MVLSDLLEAKNVAAIMSVLILLPIAAGALAYVVRAQAFRVALVLVTAWALTLASLLLYGIGSTLNHALTLNPSAVWGTVITGADIALLLLFVAIGFVRRSALITALAVAQLAAVAWFEFGLGAHAEVSPALYADWLAITMALIVSIIGSIIAVYALPYMREHEKHHPVTVSKRPRFFMILLVFLGAMNGLVLSNNLLWLYFFWEITTLCSFLLIGHDGTEEALRNASRALWINMLGGVGFVAAIIALYMGGYGLSMVGILHSGNHAMLLMLAMACLCFAGFTKAAQMPFQSWLLGAMVAPTPVSALLHSSTMVKAGVYLIVRFAPVYRGTSLSHAVAIAGAFTFVMGAFLAIGQSNAKKVLAYSTISNLGLIIACAGLNTTLALAAALMLIIFHAISKGLLFMATGVVEHRIGSRNIEDMQGLLARMPLTTLVMVLGILSMLLPPFGVLIAKLAAIEASVNRPEVLVLLVAGSALTVVFWVKWMGQMLTVEPSDGHPKVEDLHSMYYTPLILLAAGAVVFSLFVMPILRQVVIPAVSSYYALAEPGAGGARLLERGVFQAPWLFIFGAFALAVVVPLIFFRVRRGESHGAYMCGAQVDAGSDVGFRSFADQPAALTLHSYYFARIVGEEIHFRWITAVSAAILLFLFGAVYL